MEAETGMGDLTEHQLQSRRACELSERQFGAIARRQLRGVGFSNARVRSWLRTGRLHPRYPGIYAVGRPDLPLEGELAAGLLYGGSGSALAAISALWWLGFLHRRPDLIHLDAPGYVASRDDLSIHHPRAIQRHGVRGLPVVAFPRALLAATEALNHDSLRLVLARAEFAHVLDLSSMHSALTASPRGSRAVRAALDAHLPQLAHCVNGLERDFVLLCERFHLELPKPNPRIGRYRPDMLWRAHRLIVELDGTGAHSSPAQIAADLRRQTDLERMGWTVVRFRGWEVELEPERVAAEVRSRLGQNP